MVPPNAVNHFQYTGDIRMKENTQLTEQELDDISGGPHIRNFNGRTGVMLCGGTCPDAIRSKQGKRQGTNAILGQANG